MKSGVLNCLVLTFILTAFTSTGMFIDFQTRQVPIDRLFANLKKKLAQNSNDFQVVYQLARLHSMAYSTNLSTLPVDKNNEHIYFADPGLDPVIPPVTKPATPKRKIEARIHLTNAIALYQRALDLLKLSAEKTEESSWLVLPVQLGFAWCLEQDSQRDAALKAYRTALDSAWKIEVTGDFNLKLWAKDAFEDVKAHKNPLHKPPARRSLGPGPSYAGEIINYLLKLLDPVKDAKEMAQLKDRRKTLDGMGRMVTPILVPIGTETALEKLTNPDASVSFDLDGSGLARQWGWITTNAAWLVYDHDGAGRIESGLQMFGSVTFWIFWRDGYAALSSLDDNQNGILSGDELRNLALWRDLNSNGIADPGEVHPVSDYGITEISCNHQTRADGSPWNPAGVKFKDGTTRLTYDWIVQSRQNSPAPSPGND